ncbi:MAG: hypothetical protein H8E74_11625 [Gammaproteobacteria bacterium]|nr:hypothetical protein [Gammaproteobacteria bacterium]
MFQIKSKGKLLKVSIETVFSTIFKKAFVDNDKNENLEMLSAYIEFLHKKINTPSLDMSSRQLYSVYFLAGYYYKIFLNQNDVKIITEKKKED